MPASFRSQQKNLQNRILDAYSKCLVYCHENRRIWVRAPSWWRRLRRVTQQVEYHNEKRVQYRKRVNSRFLKPVTLRPVIRATPTIVRMCTLLGETKTKYCAGGAKVAHLAHYQKTTFESFARNHIAGSSKGRTLGSLPSNLGSTPSRAPKGCSRPQNTRTAREDGLFVLFVNYHQHSTLASFEICGLVICGLSFESAI